MRVSLMRIFLCVLMVACFSSLSEAQDSKRILFTSTVGPDKVLLRWAGTKEIGRFSGFNIHRRDSSSSAFVTLNTLPVMPLTSLSKIRAIFEAPGENIILDDIQSILGTDYPLEIIKLRMSGLKSDLMQLALLLNTNYGVSISEGLGYLDKTVISGKRYTYELWGLDPAGTEAERLGKVSVVAGVKTVLPEPKSLEWVPVVGPTGDRKVYLRWEELPSVDLTGDASVGFGFDIYRFKGQMNTVINDAVANLNPDIFRVNGLPIVILPAANVDKGVKLYVTHCRTCHPTRNDAKIFGKGLREFHGSTNASAKQAHQGLPSDLDLTSIFNYINDFFFMDENSLSDGPDLEYSQQYTYWVVARDLLRQHGRFSDPVFATVRDTIPPMVPYNVDAEIIGEPPNQKITIKWNRNKDGPNPLNEPGKYIDDTVKYKVYKRFGDIFADKVYQADVMQPSGTDVLTVEYTDNSIIEDDWGNIYWYHITAVDAAGNESAHSAPAKGVVHDMIPPDPPECKAFCEITNNQQEFEFCRVYIYDPEGGEMETGIVTMAYVRDADNPNFPEFGCVRPPGSDDEGIRVYRSIDGQNFFYLKDIHFSAGSNAVKVIDNEYKPRVSQHAYYKFKAFDENTNLSGFSAVSGRVFIVGDPPPSPTIVGMKLVGKDNIEGNDFVEVLISAINTEGVAGFRLYQDEYLSDAVGPSSVTAKPDPESNWGKGYTGVSNPNKPVVHVPVVNRMPFSNITSAGLGNISLDVVNKYFVLKAGVPRPSTKRYYAVTAYDFAGQESKVKLFYYWAGETLTDSKLQWPLRGGADEKTLTLSAQAAASQPIICLDWELSIPDPNPGETVDDLLDYVVFRVRGESAAPDRYVQVSPIITGPFEGPANTPEFCDMDLMFGQLYTYMVIGFGSDGEIRRSFGPASANAPSYSP